MDILRYDQLERSLERFRDNHAKSSVNKRLSGLPFIDHDLLFKLDIHRHGSRYACVALSPQLVLKIVDELIYCGLNKKEGR